MAGFAAFSFVNGNYWQTLIYSMIFLVFLVIQSMFALGWTRMFLASFIYSMTLCGVAYYINKGLGYSVLLGAFSVSTLFFFFGQLAGSNSAENTIKISFNEVAKSVVGKSVTGLALFLALFYGFGSNPAEKVSDYLSQAAGKMSSSVIKFYYPSFTPDMKVQDFFKDTALETARKTVTGFDNLSEKVKTDLLDQATADSLKQAEESYGVKIEADKTVVSQVESVIKTKVSDFLKQINPTNLSIGLAVLVFLTISTISPLIAFVVAILGTAVFELLAIFKFIKRTYEPRDKEVINL